MTRYTQKSTKRKTGSNKVDGQQPMGFAMIARRETQNRFFLERSINHPPSPFAERKRKVHGSGQCSTRNRVTHVHVHQCVSLCGMLGAATLRRLPEKKMKLTVESPCNDLNSHAKHRLPGVFRRIIGRNRSFIKYNFISSLSIFLFFFLFSVHFCPFFFLSMR